MRMAGAHCANAINVVKTTLLAYAQTGVAGGNKKDRELLGNKGNGHANPTFVFSSAIEGDAYSVHYASNPLDGFHLAGVFHKLRSPQRVIENAVCMAQSQFRTWCDAFLESVTESCLNIFLHCGDAINLCHMLQHQRTNGQSYRTVSPMFIGPWTSKPLALDGTAFTSRESLFHVVDTSNVTDHIGILNLLPATVPLLARTTSSVLYTETLMCKSESPIWSLDADLRADTATISILLGVSPCGYLLGQTAYSNLVEEMIRQLDRSCYRIQTAWRIPTQGDTKVSTARSVNDPVRKVHIDATNLGDFFIDFHSRLIAFDEFERLSGMTRPAPSIPELSSLQRSEPAYHHRLVYSSRTFVEIVRIAMTNIATDWQACLKHVIDEIERLEELGGHGHATQETKLYLQLYGLCPDANLLSRPAYNTNASNANQSVVSDLSNASRLEASCHLVMAVPRSALTKFEGTPKADTGATLALHDQQTKRVHTFVSLQYFFGSLEISSTDLSICSIAEDESGWVGSSDLIITCPIPVCSIFPDSGNKVIVSFSLNKFPINESVEQLLAVLGPNLVIWETPADNVERVHTFKDVPWSHALDPLLKPFPKMPPSSLDTTSCVSAHKTAAPIIDSLCYHESLAKGSQSSIALATDDKVQVHQSSPCTMTLHIGNLQPRLFIYPFPINGTAARTRIARASSWIEVICPLSMAGDNGGYCVKSFPVILVDGQPASWATPRVNILQQSMIDLSGNLEWFKIHMSRVYTEREAVIYTNHPRGSSSRPKDGFLDFKQTLSLIMTCFAGCNPLTGSRKYQGFVLHIDQSTEIVLYGKALRHCRNTGSVILDGWVIHQHVAALADSEFLPVGVSEEEAPVWKHLLPSIVERCRNGWIHGEGCEYHKDKRIPLSVARGASPLCSCGEGKAIEDFPAVPSVRRLARKATRIALHPLFTVLLTDPNALHRTTGASSRTVGMSLPVPEQKPKCGHCKKEKERLRSCQRCGIAQYCKHDCQKAAWKSHKKVCKK